MNHIQITGKQEDTADQLLVFQVVIAVKGDKVVDTNMVEANISGAIYNGVEGGLGIMPEEEDNYTQSITVEYLHDVEP